MTEFMRIATRVLLRASFALAFGLAACATHPASSGAARADQYAARNIVIFIADGLRAGSVNPIDAPTLLAVRHDGVNFANSHSLFPTFTTPNASAIATGHYLGDTGDFSNSGYVGFPIFNDGNFGKRAGTPTPFLENDQVLGDLNEHFANRNFLNEESLLALARERGFNTAAIGKLGPVAIQDVTQVNPVGGQFIVPRTVILDDATGTDSGVPLSAEMQAALTAAGLDLSAPPRNQSAGDVSTAGTLVPNVVQQGWFSDAATKAVLPTFRRNRKPFVLLYWSRDPDGTQHNQGDSLNTLTPGINGPTSQAAVANADANLKQILDYINRDPDLRATTDIFVTADHGFATISKHEVDAQGRVTTSYATTFEYLGRNGQPEVIPGWLPAGFLALDLAHALSLPLFDPDSQVDVSGVARYATVDPSKPASTTSRQRPVLGNGLIGGTGAVQNQTDAKVIVSAGGGSDLIYIPDHDPVLARQIVNFLSAQDYVGALFVDPAFGEIPGALPLSAISLDGAAQMPRPAIVVGLKTFSTDPANPTMTGIQIADAGLQEGQGMHGSFGRDNTFNNMAAIGPDFKREFVDRAPVSNADIARTLAHILGLEFPSAGTLEGRILSEALAGGPASIPFQRRRAVSSAAASGRATVLQYQQAAGRKYFDVACFVDTRGHRGMRSVATLCQ